MGASAWRHWRVVKTSREVIDSSNSGQSDLSGVAVSKKRGSFWAPVQTHERTISRVKFACLKIPPLYIKNVNTSYFRIPFSYHGKVVFVTNLFCLQPNLFQFVAWLIQISTKSVNSFSVDRASYCQEARVIGRGRKKKWLSLQSNMVPFICEIWND